MSMSFVPAVSPEALKAMGQQVRKWRIHMHTGLDLQQIATYINPICGGMDEVLRVIT